MIHPRMIQLLARLRPIIIVAASGGSSPCGSPGSSSPSGPAYVGRYPDGSRGRRRVNVAVSCAPSHSAFLRPGSSSKHAAPRILYRRCGARVVRGSCARRLVKLGKKEKRKSTEREGGRERETPSTPPQLLMRPSPPPLFPPSLTD